jgi:two-component system sensor histidine kinase YesM
MHILPRSFKNSLVCHLMNTGRSIMKIKNKFIIFLEKINSKITVKIITVYILIILLPMCLFFSFSYRNSINNNRKKLIYSSQNSFNQCYSHIYDKLVNIRNIAIHISYNDSFLKLINSDPKSISILEQVNHKNEIMKYLIFFDVSNNLINSHLYIDKNFDITGISNNIYSLENAASTKWFKYMDYNRLHGLFATSDYFKGDAVTYLANTNPNTLISYFYKMYSSKNYNKLAAIIRLDFHKSSLESILEAMNSTPKTTTFIMNSEKSILISSDYDKAKDWSGQISDYLKQSISSNKTLWNFNSDDSYIGIQNIKGTDWYLVSCIPDISTEQNTPLRIFSILVLIILPILSVIYLNYITYSFTNRIRLLSKNMNSIYHKENCKALTVSKEQDEITQLFDSYNYLLERIDYLLKEQASTLTKLKNMEISTLQLQMNPHFLHNILEMLLWYIRNNKAKDAENAIFTFSRFNKLALNNGDQFHTIKKELELLKAFITLSTMLSQTDTRMETDILNKELLLIDIPKMLLQPFVENSINYTIKNNQTSQGKIKITCQYKDSDIMLSIEDNGKGMNKKIMDELNSGHFMYNQQVGHGYGLKNVYERIKIIYGDNYGFYFEKMEPHGTRVSIIISETH